MRVSEIFSGKDSLPYRTSLSSCSSSGAVNISTCPAFVAGNTSQECCHALSVRISLKVAQGNLFLVICPGCFLIWSQCENYYGMMEKTSFQPSILLFNFLCSLVLKRALNPVYNYEDNGCILRLSFFIIFLSQSIQNCIICWLYISKIQKLRN